MVNFEKLNTKLEMEDALVKELNDYDIPNYMHETIVSYVLYGLPTGSFIFAVLTNDLTEAVSRADDANQKVLANYVKFLYNNVPVSCWGTKERVYNWMKNKGYIGLLEAAGRFSNEARV